MTYNLSEREKEVLELLTLGYTNNEISKKLSVVVDTTKAHISAILDKMCVENRIQAAIKAIKEGVV